MSKYETFWKAFGKYIKMGLIEDAANRTRLAKLLRYATSKSGDKEISLEEYADSPPRRADTPPPAALIRPPPLPPSPPSLRHPLAPYQPSAACLPSGTWPT